MRGWDLLSHGASIVRDRMERYGNPKNNMENFATRISLVLGVRCSAAQAAKILIELKSSRLDYDIDNMDSLVDLAGYAAVLQETKDGVDPDRA